MMDNERDELGFDRPSRRGDRKKDGGWIGLARVFLWIWFLLICAAGIMSGIAVMFESGNGPVEGVFIIIGSVLVALLSIIGGMIALDAARDIRRSADNTEEILRRLERDR